MYKQLLMSALLAVHGIFGSMAAWADEPEPLKPYEAFKYTTEAGPDSVFVNWTIEL